MTFEEYLERQPTPQCYKIALTARQKLEEFERPVCSISGGADSDVMLDILEHCKPEGRTITYIWINTGLVFEAERRQLDYLRNRYGVTIHEIKPDLPIPLAVKKHGVPFFSKRAAQYLHLMQVEGYNFKDNPEVLSPCMRDWFINMPEGKPNERSSKKNIRIDMLKYSRDFLIANPPEFRISSYCCDESKKKPAKKH